MIIGIGCDIVDINRIEKIISRDGLKAKELFLHSKEIDLKDIKTISGRFAIKEAFLKALSIGLSRGISRLKEIEVYNDISGKPVIKTHGYIKSLLKEMNISHIHLSISHEREYAIAFVIIESE